MSQNVDHVLTMDRSGEFLPAILHSLKVKWSVREVGTDVCENHKCINHGDDNPMTDDTISLTHAILPNTRKLPCSQSAMITLPAIVHVCMYIC